MEYRIFIEKSDRLLDLDGIRPYLDPCYPVPQKYIERAAQKAKIKPDELDQILADLSSHMGWDITKGSAASA